MESTQSREGRPAGKERAGTTDGALRLLAGRAFLSGMALVLLALELAGAALAFGGAAAISAALGSVLYEL